METPTIGFGKDALSRFGEIIQKEWIITNGLGGYASSTVLGINTRKYHGLLVAALHQPGDRRVCLVKLDEELCVGSDTYPLGSNEFQSGIFPQGYSFLKEFSLAPFPKYVYAVQNVEVRKTIFMPHEKNAVVTVYRVLNKNAFGVKLRVFPLANWRHFHSVTDRWRTSADVNQKQTGKEVSVSFSTPPSALLLNATGGVFQTDRKWVERIFYREENLRGESCFDDCYQLGFFEADVKANKSETFAVIAVASESEQDARKVMTDMPATMYDVDGLYEDEVKRRNGFLDKFYSLHSEVQVSDWTSLLALATNSFVVRRLDERKSVIAGYHWFESWGRDTFVSLSGLLLVTDRFEDARQVFLGFKPYCRSGLIPNYIPDKGGEPAYNTVDASLWFVNSVLQYAKYTGDFSFIKEQLWETLKEIVNSHVRGTFFNIHMDDDGLLAHGPQLTWMDVAINGDPVTPRAGKAVEVQALWFNALKTVELLAGRFGEKVEAERFGQLAERVRRSFVEKFWNEDKACLFDVVNEHGKDGSLRPNQVIAAALDFGMLDGIKAERVVDMVHQELLTPYGLRTLARSDSCYIGLCAGDRNSRDRAYHNGTVWPWLFGPFITAFLKAKGYTEFRRECALNLISPLLSKQVFEAGLGSISEVFDGEPPHKPRGCIAQAWSVAEPLRAYVEDVVQNRPKHEKEVLG